MKRGLTSIIYFVAICVFIGLSLISLNLFFGYKLPVLVKLITIPLSIPYFISVQLFQTFFGEIAYRFYESLIFAVFVYAIFGVLLSLVYYNISKKIFYISLTIISVLLIIASVLTFSSYQIPHTVSEFHNLEFEDYSLPLTLTGNLTSEKMIIYLHGGPGDSSMKMLFTTAYRELMKKYAIAFWDQPGAGNSLWKNKQRPISVDEITERLDYVVDYVKKIYPTKIILLGHSFGGELGTKYLINKQRQNKIDGWIEVDGANNAFLSWNLTREWLKIKSEEKLKENITYPEREFYKDCLDYVNTHVSLEKWYETKMYKYYLEMAGGYTYKEEIPPQPFIGEVYYLVGKSNFLVEKKNLYDSFHIYLDSLETNYFPEMKNISLPTLILWGKHDGAEPVEQAENAYKYISTPENKKKIYIFSNSAHNPMLEEPFTFASKIEEFIDNKI